MSPPDVASSNGTPSGDAGTGGAVHARDVVVVGASAGGVEALTRFVAALPADFAATVLVVLHIPARAPSALASILDRRGALPARTAVEAQPLEPGVVLVAPPDHHLVVRPADPAWAADPHAPLTVATVLGPRENGHRPCIDALFRTAAQHLGPRVVAAVLSGSDDDGTAGALAVRQRGGLVYAQSADDALYPMMPQSVVRRAGVDGQAPASDLAALVAGAVGRSAPARSVRSVPAPESDAELAREAAVNEDWPKAVLGEPVGSASGFVCPDCSGTLFTVTDEPVLRFRCRIGHAWTADGLVAQQGATVETALWTAVRTLHERAELSQRLAHRAVDEGRPASAQQFHDAARDARAAAGVLHELLAGGSGRTPLTARSTESNEAGRA